MQDQYNFLIQQLPCTQKPQNFNDFEENAYAKTEPQVAYAQTTIRVKHLVEKA